MTAEDAQLIATLPGTPAYGALLRVVASTIADVEADVDASDTNLMAKVMYWKALRRVLSVLKTVPAEFQSEIRVALGPASDFMLTKRSN